MHSVRVLLVKISLHMLVIRRRKWIGRSVTNTSVLLGNLVLGLGAVYLVDMVMKQEQLSVLTLEDESSMSVIFL